MKRYSFTQHRSPASSNRNSNLMPNKQSGAGFSLVELAIAITILVVLTAVIYFSYYAALDKADIVRAKGDMAQMAKGISIAQYKYGLTIREMMYKYTNGSDGCYATEQCGKTFRSTHIDPETERNYTLDLRNIPITDPCYAQWDTVLSAIFAKFQFDLQYDLDSFRRDPWGSPYLLNINNGCAKYITDPDRCYGPSYNCTPECSSGTSCSPRNANNCCVNDDLISVGPDGLEETADDFTFGTTPRTSIGAGTDLISGTPDDDFSGVLPGAYTGSCQYKQDGTHGGSAYCEGF
jgi:prepilin-type N-terminal cleavage/methylation domain-containing protein